ncbi:MAG: alpha/beta hydrolase [Desulforhopalus sp.]
MIIGVHGFNDYANFIKDNVPFFNRNNLAVYAYDQRGFGESKTRGRWSGGDVLAKDLATLVALVKEKHPAAPIYILGDSMGGAVTIVAMAKKLAPAVNGVILVAPAVWARSEMPFYQRWLLWVTAHTVPWKKLTGDFLKIMPSDNVAMLKELGNDPLVIKKTRVDTLYGLSDLMDEAYESAEFLDVRLLLLYGEKDEIIPQKPVIEFYQRLPSAGEGRQRLIIYENGYHMLLRDLQAERVMSDIVAWINDSARGVSVH